MQQLGLPMLTVYEGPRLVEPELVASCATYRQAVRACWMNRTRQSLKPRGLAEEINGYASHVTDYLNADDKPHRRDLPAKKINDFEIACGNRLITQWIARQAHLAVVHDAEMAVLEEFMQRTRRAA